MKLSESLLAHMLEGTVLEPATVCFSREVGLHWVRLKRHLSTQLTGSSPDTKLNIPATSQLWREPTWHPTQAHAFRFLSPNLYFQKVKMQGNLKYDSIGCRNIENLQVSINPLDLWHKQSRGVHPRSVQNSHSVLSVTSWWLRGRVWGPTALALDFKFVFSMLVSLVSTTLALL